MKSEELTGFENQIIDNETAYKAVVQVKRFLEENSPEALSLIWLLDQVCLEFDEI